MIGYNMEEISQSQKTYTTCFCMHNLPRLGRLIQRDRQTAEGFQGLGERELSFTEYRGSVWGGRALGIVQWERPKHMGRSYNEARHGTHSWEPSTQQKNCYKF